MRVAQGEGALDSSGGDAGSLGVEYRFGFRDAGGSLENKSRAYALWGECAGGVRRDDTCSGKGGERPRMKGRSSIDSVHPLVELRSRS